MVDKDFTMKIDRSKLKKSSSEVPADCKNLIDKLKVRNISPFHTFVLVRSTVCSDYINISSSGLHSGPVSPGTEEYRDLDLW